MFHYNTSDNILYLAKTIEYTHTRKTDYFNTGNLKKQKQQEGDDYLRLSMLSLLSAVSTLLSLVVISSQSCYKISKLSRDQARPPD